LFTSYAPVVNPRLAVVFITRGSDARRHLPAAIAGNIYRALSPRFGTQIDFQVAEGPDDESPNASKKAAALNEEAAETKAADEAEESGEEAGANSGTNTGSDLKVKSTTMPVESRPKTVTPAKKLETRPVRPQP